MRGRQFAAVAAHVDRDARLRGKFGPAPPNEDVLQGVRPAVVGGGAVLERDAAVREQELEERVQALGAAVDVAPAGGFVGVTVLLERGDYGVHVAGGQRPLVLLDDVGLVRLRVGLKQRRVAGGAARRGQAL